MYAAISPAESRTGHHRFPWTRGSVPAGVDRIPLTSEDQE